MLKKFLEKAKKLADLQTLIDEADKLPPEEYIIRVGKLYGLKQNKEESKEDYIKRISKYIKEKQYFKDV
jgi:hypothetical protein